jgi:hypothetical protein
MQLAGYFRSCIPFHGAHHSPPGGQKVTGNGRTSANVEAAASGIVGAWLGWRLQPVKGLACQLWSEAHLVGNRTADLGPCMYASCR